MLFINMLLDRQSPRVATIPDSYHAFTSLPRRQRGSNLRARCFSRRTRALARIRSSFSLRALSESTALLRGEGACLHGKGAILWHELNGVLKQRALSFTSFSVGGKISRQPQGIVATREALPIIACDRIMQYPLI